ncbi:MAG: germination protein YpeB [Firmicutes bacterium]|nr:germination protein YpeB [Dethiobacter sp.]MBS3889441.1 germination protein YpeB [Bacillota bacterium]MBS4054867.1 germination protein YpeB [Thermaerobacter sp.]
MRRLPWIVNVLAVVLVAGSLYWGFGQMRVKNQLLTRLENTYQRAFNDLAFNLAAIDAELGKATVAGSEEQAMIRLAAVWRQAYVAQANVGQVPLGVASLENTGRFLARIGDAVLSIASRGTMPTPEDRQLLSVLRTQAREMATAMAAVQATVLGDNVRWTDLEMKTLLDRAPRDSQVLGQFRALEDQIQQFPEITFGEHVNVARPAPLAVTAETITQATALERARHFTRDIGHNLQLVSQTEVLEAELPHYSFIFAHPQDANRHIVVEVVRSGGRVFQMFNEREPRAATMGLDAAEQRARNFLAERELDTLELLGIEEGGYSAIFTFCHVEDGILFYPDLLRVRVALDNGEILSYEGNGHVMFHRVRGNFVDQIGVTEAQAKLNPELGVVAVQRVVIFDRQGREVLCYEFTVERGKDKFLIFINAVTGREENIVRLLTHPLPMLPAGIFKP